MIATQHTQSLTDFRQNATETLERLGRTGEAEILTVNGEAKAVLMSPAAFDAMAREVQLAKDMEMFRRSAQQIEEGKAKEAGEAFRSVRKKFARRMAEKGK